MNSGSREQRQRQCAMYMPLPTGSVCIIYCNPLLPCEFWGYHSGVDENEDILGCERYVAPSAFTDVSKGVASPSSGSNNAKRISLTYIQNSILNASILPVDLFLLEGDIFKIRYGNETNAHKRINIIVHYKHSIPATCWPLSGRCITKDRYINMLQNLKFRWPCIVINSYNKTN